MHSKTIFVAFCVLAVAAVAMCQGLAEEDQDEVQHEGHGRYARAAYHHHHDGGSNGGGGGGGGGSSSGGHGDEVEYGAHTGDKGAFEWHTHHPVGQQ